MPAIAPSAIARRIAAKFWPQVQHTYRIGQGAWEFSCAGHGGMIAAIGTAEIPEAAVAVGRKHGLVHEYVVYRAQGHNRTGIAVSGLDLTGEAWTAWRNDPRVRAATLAAGEVWIGEEDSDWATLIAASDALHQTWTASRANELGLTHAEDWLTQFGGREYARDVCRRWNDAFLTDLDAASVPA